VSGHHPFSKLREKIEADPVRKARSEAYARAMEDVVRLEEQRARLILSRNGGAQEPSVSADVSLIEHEEDVYLSTLREYVEGTGGELELSAVFPEGRVTLAAKRS
jgi:hypothetical protein